ncbi:hypothetical protein [uncultured Pseudoteredinibacter sp.]|uniref:hypothetical protein n=1 Tax=uncultured Pseudoteredinibacter sp. TaxID=1641701 RepID=UPI00261C1EFA|nr:hypothetical protein [uncultured Pseudoteredinibacter sp.]
MIWKISVSSTLSQPSNDYWAPASKEAQVPSNNSIVGFSPNGSWSGTVEQHDKSLWKRFGLGRRLSAPDGANPRCEVERPRPNPLEGFWAWPEAERPDGANPWFKRVPEQLPHGLKPVQAAHQT